MFVPIAAFVVFAGVLYLLGARLMRAGKNRDEEILTRTGRRPLIFGSLTRALAGVLPCGKGRREKLRKFARTAGYYHREALEEFLALRNALAVGWILLIATSVVATTEWGQPRMFQLLLVGLVGALLLYSLPRLFLEAAAKGRLHKIDGALPDALDMITMCLTGGLPLQGSLQRVSEETRNTYPDLAFELRIVARHMETGTFEGALKHFAARIDTPESQSLAAMIGQAERQGACVAYAFQDFADNVRLARRQRADESGNKTAVKLLFPLVLCLAPPVYLMLLTPAIIELRSFVIRENQPGGVLSSSADTFRDGVAAAAETDVREAFRTSE